MFALTPVLKQRFFDANGAPLAGGQLFSYAAGTTTPQATYTDQSGATPNANPTILDSQGYANIWMGDLNYKFVLQDSLNNVLWTVDNVQSFKTMFNSFFNTTLTTTLYQRIVGSAAQVTSGIATDSTIANAVTNASSGDAILILAGTYAESPTISKKVSIFGTGENTIINGSITFASGSDYSLLRQIRTTNNITLNSGVNGVLINDVFLASGKTFTDNSSGSFCQGIQET